MTCPEMDLGEFSDLLRSRIGNQRVPLTGTLELTERCNLDCVHCYINQPAGSYIHRQRELSAVQWRDILDQIADEGCLYLLLTGGEPLLRPDLLDIYDHAKRKGFLLILFTNGTLITPEFADHLREWYPYLVEITLYGATAETYEKITGVRGSFERCLRGIELLQERGVPLRLKTMVMTLNRHEFTAIRAIARERGLDFRFDVVLNPRRDGAKRPVELRLAPQEAIAVELSDERNLEGWRHLLERSPNGMPQTDMLYTCGAGLITFRIDPYGNLTLCPSSAQPSYPLVGGDFHFGWHVFLKEARRRKITKSYPCRTCEVASLCGNCPEMASLENGDPESAVGYRCQLAHLRAEELAVERRPSR